MWSCQSKKINLRPVTTYHLYSVRFCVGFLRQDWIWNDSMKNVWWDCTGARAIRVRFDGTKRFMDLFIRMEKTVHEKKKSRKKTLVVVWIGQTSTFPVSDGWSCEQFLEIDLSSSRSNQGAQRVCWNGSMTIQSARVANHSLVKLILAGVRWRE